MPDYQVTYDDGRRFYRGSLPAPEVLPVAGQVLVFAQPCWTLANRGYAQGDTLTLLHRTDQAPHYRRSSLGNWLVQCKFMESVWTNIEMMLATGIVKIQVLETQ